MSTAQDHNHPGPLPDGMVIKATVAAALIPGAGHLLLKRPALAALLFVFQGACATAAVVHLTQELAFFYADPGSFLFGVLLRSMAVVYAFSVIDAYIRAVDPAGSISPPKRRWAVLLNLLVPGAGYIYIRAWIGAVGGLALVTLFLWRSTIPYLDLVFILLQGVLALVVYRRVRLQEVGPDHEPGEPMMAGDPLPQVGAGQIVALVTSVVATVVFCGVVLLRLPVPQLGLTFTSARVKPTHDRIKLAVPDLGLTMDVMGAGWSHVAKKPGKLFWAEHRGEKVDARLYLNVRPIPVFMSREYYLSHHLPDELHDQGIGHYSVEELRVGGARATQFRFTGFIGSEKRTFFVVVLPGSRYACMLTFYCAEEACADVWPLLRRSRDSLKVEAVLVAQGAR